MSFNLPIKTININVNGDDSRRGEVEENKVVVKTSTEGKVSEEDVQEITVNKTMTDRTTVIDDDEVTSDVTTTKSSNDYKKR